MQHLACNKSESKYLQWFPWEHGLAHGQVKRKLQVDESRTWHFSVQLRLKSKVIKLLMMHTVCMMIISVC